ncbi:MAG: UDP-N-acetylmuramate--L-alanine ligase [Opitutales bacterium]
MHFYFMGICGTAMGNAALLLKQQGHQVTGADQAIYPPMSDQLQQSAIQIYDTYDPQRLAALKPDFVVVGNAMSRGHPEVEWLLEQSDQAYLSLPELIRKFLLHQRYPIVVTGTHGKTSTTALIAFLLQQCGRPGWLIGGCPHDLCAGAHLGEDAHFVIEGDEYDSAFFDKRSKFIHYQPKILLVNNLEFDHADIFRDFEAIHTSFLHLLKVVPASGKIILNGDDPQVLSLREAAWSPCFLVGTQAHNDLIIAHYQDAPQGAQFDLIWQGTYWTTVQLNLHGLYNARNVAMAALATAFAQSMPSPIKLDLQCLSAYRGVVRRQDVRYKSQNTVVIEDFAHHPTALAHTIGAVKAAYPEHRLVCCFEPRSNTAQKSIFQDAFTEAFQAADEIFLGPVFRAERLPNDQRLNTERMASHLRANGQAAQAFASNLDLLDSLKNKHADSAQARVYLFCSNGSFDGIISKAVAWLKDQEWAITDRAE